MSDYPDRMAVLKSICGIESNLSVLKNFVDSYEELREKDGPDDELVTTFARDHLIPKAEDLELTQRELAAHLPKMLAAGDAATELVERTMKANDDAASYSRELRATLCPELFGDGSRAVAGAQARPAPAGHGAGTVKIKTMTGKLIPIDANLSDTIATIKLRYRDSAGTPPDQQRLILKGKELVDGATLTESGVQLGDTLHLVLKLRTASDSADNAGKGAGGGCCSLQ